jgi:hypothetical protein
LASLFPNSPIVVPSSGCGRRRASGQGRRRRLPPPCRAARPARIPQLRDILFDVPRATPLLRTVRHKRRSDWTNS